MPITKPEHEFERFPLRAGALVWQIDNDRLPPPMDDGEWESQFAETLVDLAEAHKAGGLTCSTYGSASVDFGHHGISVWIALTGSKPLVKAAADILRDMIPDEFIRSSTASSEMRWAPRIRIADGKVWCHHDGAEWSAISLDEDNLTGEDEGDSDGDQPADASTCTTSPESNTKRRKVLNAARDDVSVGYYQRKIERLLSLPIGSVKLINPDRSISHSGQLIGSLRRRWEND